jgi:putative membrane protein
VSAPSPAKTGKNRRPFARAGGAGLCDNAAMKLVLRILITAVAVAVAAALLPGIQLPTSSTGEKILTIIVVALIFGLVNAILKPIIKVVGCIFYVITLGLIGLVVNGLLFWLTSWVAGKLSLPFHITGFWAAFWGAIIVGIVGWLLNLFLTDDRDSGRARR